MANEIQVATMLRVQNAANQPTEAADFKKLDQTNTMCNKTIQSLAATTDTAIDLGAIAAADIGYCWFKNLHATATIKIGTTGAYFILLNAGESAVFRIDASVAPYAYASAAADLQCVISED